MDKPIFTNRSLARLIGPLILEQLLAVTIGMADTIMVTGVGEHAVSAISLVDAINLLLIQVFSALATGGAVVAAQYLGARARERACDTAKQALVGMDGLMDMVELKKSGYLREKARELKERAILFMEEMVEAGGYFAAVEAGMFVDSGLYPERNGDGIARKLAGGIGAGTIYKREADYMAPVTAHYGYNNIAQYGATNPSDLSRGGQAVLGRQ